MVPRQTSTKRKEQTYHFFGTAPELHKPRRKDLPLFWYHAKAPKNVEKRPTAFLVPRQTSTKRKEKTYRFFDTTPELQKMQRKALPLFWYRATPPPNAMKRPTTFLVPCQSSTKHAEKTYYSLVPRQSPTQRKEKIYHFFGFIGRYRSTQIQSATRWLVVAFFRLNSFGHHGSNPGHGRKWGTNSKSYFLPSALAWPALRK